tara:strand:+ start:54 stop:1712 length:1659 start_codon:yes stop_codon:yes gene_type:complete
MSDRILGEVFDTFVDTQVNIRQKRLQKSQKDADDLKVFNASTPWIRLSSSVQIEGLRVKQLAENLNVPEADVKGFNLAKKLVLFAGTSDEGSAILRGGVGYGLSTTYGFLSDKQQGYKPMPGITGITANYKNNGSLKQAQVSIKCYTRKQFEAIEAIYLRLGYSMVLEWGHSLYFDNTTTNKQSGTKQLMNAPDIPSILFNINGDKRKPENIHTTLLKTKERTGGNYDGMLAKVSNFSWKLSNDLSYDIVLDLISVGDIIDSLKMNIGGKGLTSETLPNIVVDQGIQNTASIQLAANISAFNSFLYELISQTTTKEATQGNISKSTQAQLERLDQARGVLGLVGPIQDAYLPALEALREAYYTSWEDMRNLLLQMPYINYEGNLYRDNLRWFGSQEKLLEIAARNRSITPNTTRLSFYSGLNLIIAGNPDPATKNIFRAIVTNNPFPDSMVGTWYRSLSEGLNELQRILTQLTPINTATVSNIELIEYLDSQKASPETVLRNVLSTGFLDGVGGKYKVEGVKLKSNLSFIQTLGAEDSDLSRASVILTPRKN